MEAQATIVRAELERDEFNVEYRCDCNGSPWSHAARMIVFECPSCQHISDKKVCQQWPISEFDCFNCYARISVAANTITNAR